MNWNDLENKFQELNGHSLTPSSNATFEEVMNRRKKKKRRVIVYWSFAGIALIGVVGFFANSYIKALNSIDSLNTKTLNYHNNSNKLSNNVTSEDGLKNIKQNSSTLDFVSSDKKTTDLASNANSEFSTKSKKYISANSKSVENSNTSNSTTPPQKIALANSEVLVPAQNKPKESVEIMSSEISQHIRKVESLQEYLNANSEQMSSSSINDVAMNLNWTGANLSGSSLKPINLNWDPQLGRIDWIEGPWDLEPRTPYIDKRPMYLEFSAITGSRSQIDFDLKQSTSILGTQYMAQYQLLLLRETWDEFLWGMGVQYTEWIGNGQWRNVDRFNVQVIDTSYRIVKIPGQPDYKIQIIDTILKEESNITTGKIGYKMDNISIPIAFRKISSAFRTPIRIGAQFSPGFTTYTRGEYFSSTEYQTIGKTRRPTLNAKLSAGPQIQVTGDFSLIIEPSLMYHSFVDVQSKFNGRWFTGLGVSMQWRLK